MTTIRTVGAAAGLRAVILAGGRGTRLGPFSVSFPKPLVPLGDTPVLEVLIRRLVGHGITDITLTLGHLAELITAYFARRRRAGQPRDAPIRPGRDPERHRWFTRSRARARPHLSGPER